MSGVLLQESQFAFERFTKWSEVYFDLSAYSLSEVYTLCSQSIKLTPLRFIYEMDHEITVYFVLFMALLEYQNNTSLGIYNVVILVCKCKSTTAFHILYPYFFKCVFIRWCLKHIENYVIYIFLVFMFLAPSIERILFIMKKYRN